MKETRYFYAPDLAHSNELPTEEAQHIVRTLRLKEGDALNLVDGRGTLALAHITMANAKHCMVEIDEQQTVERTWHHRIALAVAPTKNIDRTEWFAEKATEIGLDELYFLSCAFSERKSIRTDRIERIVVSAMKQSHKTWKPEVNEQETFSQFIQRPFEGQKFIAHCYNEADVEGSNDKPFLLDALSGNEDALVCIGPEGDFSVDEVKEALAHGFQSISLGESRLRTETAALAAVHLMQIANR